MSDFGLLIRAETLKLATRLRQLNSPIKRVTKDAVLLDLPPSWLDLLKEGIEAALNEEVKARAVMMEA